MPRVSVMMSPGGTTALATTTPFTPRQRAFFERVFIAQDDLLFDVPTDAAVRPRQMMRGRTASTAPVPLRPSEMPAPPSRPARRAAEGDILAGHRHARGVRSGATPPDQRLYSVSVVVFRKRTFLPPFNPANPMSDNPEKPGERIARADLIGFGIGGGDVRLSIGGVANPGEYLNVRENEWLMLCGQEAYPGGVRGVFKWYRIVAVGETVMGTPSMVDVTFAGPDWNSAWNLDLDTPPNVPQAQAVLFNTVVGVYSQTVEADRLAPWSNPNY